jgi:hypothetical protein
MKPAFNIPFMPGALTKSKATNMKPNKLNVSSQKPGTKLSNIQESTMAAESNGRKGKGRKSKEKPSSKTYVPPVLRLTLPSDSGSSSSSSDSFLTSPNRTIFYDDSRGEAVKFDYHLEPTVSTQQLEQPQETSAVSISKFVVNLAKYHRNKISVGEQINSYVTRQLSIIYTQMSRDIVKSIRSKIVDKWTFVNFHNALQTAIEGLSLFYTLDSIQSYSGSDVARDKNVQNLNLQKMIEVNPQILYLKDDLRRSLKGVWIPPILSGLIRWTYQLYKTADLDQACNYRFFPHQEFIAVNDDDDAVADKLGVLLTRVLNEINDPNNATIWSILSQVYPEGEIVGLPLSCNTAVYDPRHLEILANQPVLFEYANSGFQMVPDVTNPDASESFVYGMNTAVKGGSGLPFVLQSLYSDPNTPIIDFLQTFRYTGIDSLAYHTNKFYLRPNGYYRPRLFGAELVGTESPDVHLLELDSGLTVEVRKSTIPSEFQPVYFDIVTAPLINLRDFMSDMFSV